MFKVVDRQFKRQKRRWRIRKRLIGTLERPRLSVHRSHQHLYLQLVDDSQNKTLFAFSTKKKEFQKASSKGGNIDGAKTLGELASGLLKAKGFESIVFDRGGYLYHGRIAALAESLRKGGIQF